MSFVLSSISDSRRKCLSRYTFSVTILTVCHGLDIRHNDEVNWRQIVIVTFNADIACVGKPTQITLSIATPLHFMA